MRVTSPGPIVTIFTVAVLSATLLEAQAPFPIVPQVLPAIVGVEVAGTDRNDIARTVSGTGFFIDESGFLITAAHVFRAEDGWKDRANGTGPDFKISVRTGGVTLTRASVIYLDEQADLALVRVEPNPGQSIRALRLGDSRVIDPGFGVAAFGSDAGEGVFRGRGNVSVAFDSSYFGVFKVNVTTERGDSGAPVVDDQSGVVLGVIRAGVTNQPRTYVTPINLAANLVQIIRSSDAPYDFARQVAVPLGTILAYFGTLEFIPSGFLPCDGSKFDRRKYPSLYDLLVATAPALRLDESQALLPDLRGEFLRGADGGRGVDPNRQVGSFQGSAFEKHTHPLSQGVGVSGGWAGGWGGVQEQRAVNAPGDGPMVVREAGGSETRPRNLAVMFVIKATSP